MPPKDWNPNAPDLKSAFSGEKPIDPELHPVSRLEQETLENQRNRPGADHAPKPPGQISQAVDAQMHHQREQRIKEIREKLEAARSRARDDFGRSR